MSLCVAWRWEEQVCIAADTCISAGNREEFGGIKVLAVPVEIRRPPSATAGNFPLANAATGELIYRRLAGITFSGSYLTAYVVKEILSEVLSHLQYVDDVSTLTFDRIAQVAFRHYSYHFERLKNSLGTDYELEVILAGYCLVTKKVQAFRFWEDWDGHIHFSEVITERPFSYDVIGSGKRKFMEIFEQKRCDGGLRVHFDIPRTIREIIRSKEILSVAGTVQYGEFDQNADFKLYGIIDRNEKDGLPMRNLFIRGTDIESANPDEDDQGLYLHYDFKDVFEDT